MSRSKKRRDRRNAEAKPPPQYSAAELKSMMSQWNAKLAGMGLGRSNEKPRPIICTRKKLVRRKRRS